MTIDPDNDMGKIIDAFLRLSAANLRVRVDEKELATVECGDARLARTMERLNGMGRLCVAHRAGVQNPVCSSSAGLTRRGD